MTVQDRFAVPYFMEIGILKHLPHILMATRRAETGLRVQHFTVLRFLPMAPRFCTLRI